MKKFFTSESVTEGHPDKVCDQISDAILDAVLEQDPMARVAVECCAAYDMLLIMGEVTTTAKVDYASVARETIENIGYNFGSFAYDKCRIQVEIHEQSPDIAMGVNSSMEDKELSSDIADSLGAGDPGTHVRLCVQRNEGVYASSRVSRSHARSTARSGKGRRNFILPSSGRENSGYG